MDMQGITRQNVAVDGTYENGAATHDMAGREDQATRLRYALASAGGSWGREFRLLLALADGRGVALDAESLAFYDVRDLQALQRRIVTAAPSRGNLVAMH